VNTLTAVRIESSRLSNELTNAYTAINGAYDDLSTLDAPFSYASFRTDTIILAELQQMLYPDFILKR
jgi:hypothetical protein